MRVLAFLDLEPRPLLRAALTTTLLCGVIDHTSQIMYVAGWRRELRLGLRPGRNRD